MWSHYFDVRDNSGAKSSYQGFLLSLLQQMGFQQAHIHPALQHLYQSCKHGLLVAPPTNFELENTLSLIIQGRTAGYIILDAMDECNKLAQQQVFNWLSSYSSQLCIAITSRYPLEGKAADGITLDSADSGIYQDISLFLETELKKIGFNESLHNEILQTLLSKSQGQ